MGTDSKSFYTLFGKRLFDILFSFLALLATSLIFYLVIVVIVLNSRGGPFFIQKRYGKGARPFRLIKFRSMAPSSLGSSSQFEPGCSKRITRVGYLLRKTKIDELPELINVLKGDMSVVGPRPEVGKYIHLFHDDFKETLKIRPGLTDLASIKYRDEEAILYGRPDAEQYYQQVILPDKLNLAKYYSENLSFHGDLRIILDTLKSILKNFLKDLNLPK